MRRSAGAMVMLVMMASLVSAGPAAAEDDPTRPTSNARKASAASQRETLRYWTGARMRSARAAVAPEPARRIPRTGVSDDTGGSGSFVQGSRGGDTSAPAGGSSAVYEYPFPYTRYAVDAALYTLYPYRTIGKIFFRRGGVDLVCSGASVVGGPRHIVFTAGHCLNNGAGVYSKKVVFVPAYRNGNRPFGTFPATELWVIAAWDEEADSTYDYAAFSVGRNAVGRTLGAAVGELGFTWDNPRDLHWSVFGFPVDDPFSGETMQVCYASRAVDDIGIPGIGADPIGIGCDQTGGSSGGPWIFRLKRGNYLNSVMSYGYETQPEGSYGPYLDGSANLLRCAAATGDPEATDC